MLYVGFHSTWTDYDMARRALVQCTDIIVESNIDSIVLARKLYSGLMISENVY